MKKNISIIVIFLISVLTIFSSGGGGDDNGTGTPCIPLWSEHTENPVINWRQEIDTMIWNDPSVIRENGSYRMWLSGGPGLGVNHVKIYEALSEDGIDWDIDPTVLLEPDSTVTISGTGLTPSNVSGTYILEGENQEDLHNGRPLFKHQNQEWYIWYNNADNFYYISNILGDTTTSWKNTVTGTLIDGDYLPELGGTTGDPTAAIDWDSEKTETPMVVKAGNTYHMYYSGFKIGDGGGRYQTGHATSPDGIIWTKDPANPIIAYHDDPSEAGFYQAAEPGVVYDPDTEIFYLYYKTVKIRDEIMADDPQLQHQSIIALATSTDGFNFTHYDANNDSEPDAVFVQSADYPVSEKYNGYSTPYPYIDAEGTFHLFCSVVYRPDENTWRQVAISHATSSDGRNFTEVEADVYTNGGDDWKDFETWGPSLLMEDNVLKMWFAGDNEFFFQENFIFGIGYATYGENCVND